MTQTISSKKCLPCNQFFLSNLDYADLHFAEFNWVFVSSIRHLITFFIRLNLGAVQRRNWKISGSLRGFIEEDNFPGKISFKRSVHNRKSCLKRLRVFNGEL